MLSFLKKDDNELTELDSCFLNTLQDLDNYSKIMQFELMKQRITWSHDKVQTFIPLILHYTNFEWLELIAEHELSEEEEMIVKNYLEKVQLLILKGETKLCEIGDINGVL